MRRSNRTQLILGLLLILAGAWLFARQNVPAFREWLATYYDWPLAIVAVGILILLIGLVVGDPDTAIPASIVAGIGGILYYQEASGDWASWAYMWTLIPGFVGVGNVLAALLGAKGRGRWRHGLNLMVISAVLFLAFSSLFGAWDLLGNYIPATLIILLGVFLVARGLYRSTRA